MIIGEDLIESDKYIISKILDGVDFERIHKMMVAVDWRWYDRSNTLIVPSIDMIQKNVYDLVHRELHRFKYKRDEPYYIATGGIYVEYISDLELDWYECINISFKLEANNFWLEADEKLYYNRMVKLEEIIK